MLQLKNNTPFAAAFAVFPDAQGIDTLYLMVKATFAIGSQWTVADEQMPLHEADQYWGDPETSSLKTPSDYHIGKPATDILMYGLACAPQQKPVRQLDVGLEVGPLRKILKVFGERVITGGRISEPSPFVNMPIVYERAFGGSDQVQGQLRASFAKNPVGCGFIGGKMAAETEGLPLPNIEFPDQLIQRLPHEAEPAGFGPLAPGWQPRAAFAGTYDQTWQQTRAPYLPADFNPGFLNVAPRDQIYPGFLRGGEQVRIVGMHPEGDFNFSLPTVALSAKVQTEDGDSPAAFDLETLALFPNQRRISMTWRAAIPCDKHLLKIQQISISLTR